MGKRQSGGGRPAGRALDVTMLMATRPDGTCPSRKLRYASEARALKALNYARQTRLARHHGNIAPAGLEKRVYKCERCQNGWHLTSREHWEDRYAERPVE